LGSDDLRNGWLCPAILGLFQEGSKRLPILGALVSATITATAAAWDEPELERDTLQLRLNRPGYAPSAVP